MLINQKVLFNGSECQTIINLNKTNLKYWDTNEYKYNSMGILYSNETKWIFDKLTEYFVSQTNADIISLKEEIHFHTYKKGESFVRHNDAKKNRIYGVGVILNNTFDGGDFIFYDKETIVIDKEIGNAYIFDVITDHEVKEITDGFRYSLLWFLENSNLKIKKNSLI